MALCPNCRNQLDPVIAEIELAGDDLFSEEARILARAREKGSVCLTMHCDNSIWSIKLTLENRNALGKFLLDHQP